MKPDEIKKDLKHAMDIGDAPIGKYFGCIISKLTAKETFDYINHLEAKNKRLEKEISIYQQATALIGGQRDVLDAETESLNAELERKRDECEYWESEAKIARAELTENAFEAVQVFAERVKQIICENTHPEFNKEGKPVNVWNAKDGYRAIDNLCSEYGAK